MITLPTSIALQTRPTVEPLTLQEVKDHLNLDDDNSNLKLQRLIQGAREWAEAAVNQKIVRQKWRIYFDDFADWMRLKPSEVQEVAQIQYVDTAGATQTLATTVYSVDIPQQLVYLAYGQSWPSVYVQPSSVWIDVWSGMYSTLDSPMHVTARIPESIKQSMLMMVADNFVNTEVSSVQALNENPAAKMLLRPHWRPYE